MAASNMLEAIIRKHLPYKPSATATPQGEEAEAAIEADKAAYEQAVTALAGNILEDWTLLDMEVEADEKRATRAMLMSALEAQE